MSTFWKIFISMVVATLVAGGGIFYIMQRQINSIRDDNQAKMDDLNKQIATLKSTTSTSTTTDATADWKTYTSIKNSYLIKYPSDWFLYGADSVLYIQKSQDKSTPGDTFGQYSSAFEISVKAIASSKTISDAVNDRIKEINSTSIDYDQKPITISGQSGIELISKCDGLGCGNPDWLVIKNSNLYTFKSNLGYTKTFDTILSTFQFTK